jgi:hypothetical protein
LWRESLSFAVLLGLIPVSSAHSDTVMGYESNNGVQLEAKVTAEFSGRPPAVDDDMDIAHVNYGTFGQARASRAAAFAGAPGAEARISVENTFEFGTMAGFLPNDRWSLRIEATASAVGAPAAARVEGQAITKFFVDPPRSGWLLIDEIRLPTPKEELLAATLNGVIQGIDFSVTPPLPDLPFHFSWGLPATPFLLRERHSYEISVNYELEVPPGEDPPILVELGATIVPIPEPSTITLTILLPITTACITRRQLFYIVAGRTKWNCYQNNFV